MFRYFERIYRSSSGKVCEGCMYNERSNMYVQDGKFKIKLFTKLANQNSYNEARAIGRI